MQNETTYGNGFFQIIKGVALALAFSFLSTIIFANVLRYSNVADALVYPINQLIKAAAILLGGIVFIRGDKGFLKRGGLGALFTALSYLAFSAIGGDFSLSWLIFIELFVAVLLGALVGALAVNVRRG